MCNFQKRAAVRTSVKICFLSFSMTSCQRKKSQTAFVNSKNSTTTSSAVHIHRPRVKDSLGIPAGPAPGIRVRCDVFKAWASVKNTLLQELQISCSCPDFLIPTVQQMVIPRASTFFQPNLYVQQITYATVPHITAIHMHLVY